MEDFIKKWKEDKKYQAKIKLILYGVFIILVVLYASTLNTNTPKEDKKEIDTPKEETTTSIINFPSTYSFNITINLDDEIYEYYGDKLEDVTFITKVGEPNTKYTYRNNEYYLYGTETIVTEKEVYDVIDRKYLDIDNINKYLNKANKYGEEYYVYLKDIIEDDDSDEYITITLGIDNINIDYTLLMKKLNGNNKCTVEIKRTPLETINE